MNHAVTARLLIVFMLLASFGWVTDLPADDDFSAVTAPSAAVHDDGPDGNKHQHGYHATAHLLSLPNTVPTLCLHGTHSPIIDVEARISSYITAPPCQPPRS